jgi:hypothetical protein
LHFVDTYPPVYNLKWPWQIRHFAAFNSFCEETWKLSSTVRLPENNREVGDQTNNLDSTIFQWIGSREENMKSTGKPWCLPIIQLREDWNLLRNTPHTPESDPDILSENTAGSMWNRLE